ncbi:MAG: hypothetical protein Q8Q03_03255 [bacterium]|nr:hypothetical protein [bacterium]
MSYLHWKEENISDFSDENTARMYGEGFVFTRAGRGIMHQTRSVRIDLSKFELSSENRRILKKVEVEMKAEELPYKNYSWEIGKMGKDFYESRDAVFTANKIKELLTTDHNFNLLLNYSDIGYAICFEDKEILHYSYPFYKLDAPKDTGLGMMIKAIIYAKENGLKYIYLGSLQRPSDTYKLQFEGLEWFDGEMWSKDLEEAKKVLFETLPTSLS